MTTPGPFILRSRISPQGSNDHAVAVRHPAIFMLSPLSDCQQVALVLDGARTQQDFPVRATGRVGKGGRHHDQIDRRQGAIKLGKAQVVADRQGNAAKWGIDRSQLIAGFDESSFIVSLISLS
jgi:hypothetical protein